MGSHGWPFAKADAFPGAGDDPVMGAEHIKDIYLAVQPDYDGKCVIFSEFTVYANHT
jgi:putative glutathione S-transferase